MQHLMKPMSESASRPFGDSAVPSATRSIARARHRAPLAAHRLARIGALAIVAVASLLAGCSHKYRMKDILVAYEAGNYPDAVTKLEPLLADRRDSEKDQTLYELEAGAVYSAARDLEKSIAAFRTADERMWPYMDVKPDVRVSEQVAAFFTNQTIIAYTGRPHDRIMCLTYQALNHLERGDLDKAGIALRRAQEWQQDAKDRYADEIEKLEQQANARAKSEQNFDAKRAQGDPAVQQGLDARYKPIRNLQSYADFTVPYTSLLRGLRLQFSGSNTSIADARTVLSNTAAMLPEKQRSYVLEDVKLADDMTRGAAFTPSVYVIVETGMAPRLDSFELNIPLFIPAVPYIGAAFPVLKVQEGAVSGFTARAGSSAYPSSLLTDMDSVVGGDFNRRLPGIIALTIASSATKALATYAAQEAAGDGVGRWIAAGVGAVYQFAVNDADLRTWVTLPKQVLYARFPAPADGVVSVDLGDGQRVGPINVEAKGATIVHVRTPRVGAAPATRVMRFVVK